MQLHRPLIALSAAVLFGLAACGGDGDSGAEEDITSALKRGVVGQDVKARCEEVTTKGFIQRVYGDVAQCRKAEKPEPDDKPATGVRVSEVKVDGERATAKVRYVGGDVDGSEGSFEFLKEGGDWRIDDLGVDLLRSQVKRALSSGDQESAVLRDPKVRDCAAKAFLDLPDEKFKRVAYAEISKRPSSRQELARVVSPCLSQTGSASGPGSTSFLREKFEQGLATSARRRGVPQATIACINKELRSAISDKEIQQTATGGGKVSPELKGKATAAIKACGAE